VYHKGRMVRKRELPLFRRLTACILAPLRVVARGLRKRRLGRWVTACVKEDEA